MRMSLGPTLARLRSDRRLSLRAVGAAIGRSAATVLAHERGESEVPLELYRAYGELYGVQITTLVLPGDVPDLSTLDPQHQAAAVAMLRCVGLVADDDLARLVATVRAFTQPIK